MHRKAIFRFWRRCAETMSWDDFADHVTTQAVGCHHLEKPEGENTFEMVRQITRLNSTFTVRQACLAMEVMDLEPLVQKLERPILMTNGTYDMLCPPVLAKSGFSARQIAELKPGLARLEGVPRHRPRRPARVPGRGGRDRHGVLPRGARRASSAASRPADARPPGVADDAPVERAVRGRLVDLGLEARELGGRHAAGLLEAAPEVRPVVRDERVAAPLRRVEHDDAAILGLEAGGGQPAAQAPARPAVGLAVGPGLHDAAAELAIGDVEALRVPVGVGREHDAARAARCARPRAARRRGRRRTRAPARGRPRRASRPRAGATSASASTSSQPSPRAPTASSIARAESIAVTCAPRALSASANAPGPQPTSAMRQPGCGPSRSICALAHRGQIGRRVGARDARGGLGRIPAHRERERVLVELARHELLARLQQRDARRAVAADLQQQLAAHPEEVVAQQRARPDDARRRAHGVGGRGAHAALARRRAQGRARGRARARERPGVGHVVAVDLRDRDDLRRAAAQAERRGSGRASRSAAGVVVQAVARVGPRRARVHESVSSPPGQVVLGDAQRAEAARERRAGRALAPAASSEPR